MSATAEEVLGALARSGFDAAEIYTKRGRSRRVHLAGRLATASAAQEEGWAVRAGNARGELGEAVGPFCLRASVIDLLSGVSLLGNVARPAGAGWCAKGGQALPVWAHAPSMLIEGLEVSLS